MRKVDAHIHYIGDHSDCLVLLGRLDLKLLNVCVAHDSEDPWLARAATYRQLAQKHPSFYAWATTFAPPDFSDPDYVDRVIRGLERDRDAVACKVWKNVGMAIRKPSGDFLMVDDPLFDPIYRYLARSGKTLLTHIGEPLACWLPLDNTDSHYGYYSQHPEWHMYNRPGYPSHQELIDARDRVLAKYPQLRVVGAHLGSLEHDVREVAKRLERYPNFAVDTAARIKDLGQQDVDLVREFFVHYQDRILFGTDIVEREPLSSLAESDRRAKLRAVEERYSDAFRYFELDQVVTVRGRKAQGLGLDEEVLAKVYCENAQRWYPGI
jgi:predicted TIM-barrel fold metal-dependent hydrolase